MLKTLENIRHRAVQAIGAGLSVRNWHATETAYNELRDRIDALIIDARANDAMLKTMQTDAVMQAILKERSRQLGAEGYTPSHDDAHKRGEIAGAAACYVLNGLQIPNDALRGSVNALTRDLWPWASSYWKPKSRKCDLIRAAALIVAEIERMERIEVKAADADAYVNDRASGIYD